MVAEIDQCRFRVLGPVQVVTSHGPVMFRRRQQIDLLAFLLLHAGRVLPVDQIVDAMWGGSVPRTARAQIKNMVSDLRRCLSNGPRPLAELDREPAGYRLRITDGRLDLDIFAALRSDARTTAAPDAVVGALRRALGLWQGEALAGVRADFAGPARARLQEQRAAALEDLFDVELERGNHLRIVAELPDAVAEHPGRERLAGQLMIALYRSGRAGDALDVYQRLRQTLADGYGLEPGSELRSLERSILLGDPALDLIPPRTVTAASSSEDAPDGLPPTPSTLPTPAQLPSDIAGFVGRDSQIAQLDLLVSGRQGSATAVVISALTGTAGVGKTALAVHWAHRVAGRFPDGQFYVNLRGYGPGGAPMSPAEALRGFLDALAVAPERIPPGLDMQAALYRSLMVGRRMLVVLDNAANAEQVRPLLPGAPDCMVLVTSRSRLVGLVASEGAVPITLDLPTGAEARDLLAARLGAERVAAEESASAEIVTQCARLPLALAVVAARAAVQPTFPLGHLSAELSRSTLRALSDPAGGGDVRTVFSWSYKRLSPTAARLYRLLGLHPGPDVSVAAAASLAGVAAEGIRRQLIELVDAHLVAEHRPDRFAMHDLLRAYAVETALTVDSEQERRDAVGRMLDHYLHSASTAGDQLYPHRYRVTLAPPANGVTVEILTDHERALEWFNAEHRALVAAVGHAAAADLSTHAWQLASTIAIFLYRRCHSLDFVDTQQSALLAAERAADRVGQANSNIWLGTAYGALGDDDLARAHLRRALTLFGELGDRVGQAYTRMRLGWVAEGRAEHTEALHQAEQALDLFQAVGNRPGCAYAMNGIGWYHAMLGHYREAVAHCERAVDLHRELGNRQGAAQTLDSLGFAYHQLGAYSRAVSLYLQSAELLRECGSRFNEASVLIRLGDSHCATGRADLAREAWLAALRIFDALDHPRAEQVTAKIRTLDAPSA